MRILSLTAWVLAAGLPVSCAGGPDRVFHAGANHGDRQGQGNARLTLPRAVGGDPHPYPAYGWKGPRQYPEKGFYSSHPGYP